MECTEVWKAPLTRLDYATRTPSALLILDSETIRRKYSRTGLRTLRSCDSRTVGTIVHFPLRGRERCVKNDGIRCSRDWYYRLLDVARYNHAGYVENARGGRRF
jgi:hypothetical protein